MRKRLLAAIAALAVSSSLLAQAPYLVTDINTDPIDIVRGSYARDFQQIGDTLFFNAEAYTSGRELWQYRNGVASQVLDLNPGTNPSSISTLTRLSDGVHLFSANDGVRGSELWRTDGSAAGTSLVKDTYPGQSSGVSAGPRTVFNGRMFFVAADGVHGSEPWVTDGTEAGTQMFIDLYSGPFSSGVTGMVVLGDRLLIFGSGGVWSSDGTAAGTTFVATTGIAREPMRVDSTVFFPASGSGGFELWKTDGTTAGTMRVKDIAAGTWSGLPNGALLGALGSTLYFLASPGPNGTTTELWKSDGTTDGTQAVKLLSATSTPKTGKAAFLSNLFILQLSNGATWRSDGTTAGTTLLVESGANSNVASAFGRLFYSLDITQGSASALWSYDGVTKTRIANSDGARDLQAAGGKLYFNADDGVHGHEPYVSDDGSTVRALANINGDTAGSSTPISLTAIGNTVVFTATDGITGRELWRSDGTPAGTGRITSAAPQAFDLLTAWNGVAYFKHDGALWKTDGTVGGTTVIQPTSWVNKMFPATRYLFLDHVEYAFGRTDGTEAGTIPLGAARATSFAELTGRVYALTGLDSSGTGALVATDGDLAARRISTFTDGSPSELTAAAGLLFFTRHGVNGKRLWRSDGTIDGETMVKDILVAGYGSTAQLRAAGRYLFFVATDGVSGEELWRSDGTAAGTIMLKNIGPGSVDGGITNLTAAGDLVYFSADDGVNGRELWRSDGSEAGTVMVADLRPGSGASRPSSLAFLNGTLWFNADVPTFGAELFRMNGATPQLVADLEPGAGPSQPGSFVQAGARMFFTATTTASGEELWAMAQTGSVLSIGDARVVEGTGGTRTMRFTVTRSGTIAGVSSASFATSNGTAGASDFTARTGTVTFAAGETSRFIDVTVQSDSVTESVETFFVTLSSPSGAVLSRATGAGVIDDDDRHADISVEFLHGVFGGDVYHVRIRNAGPDRATETRLRFSSSPGAIGFLADGLVVEPTNPFVVMLDPIEAGSAFDLTIHRSGVQGFVDAALPPGLTVTASVSPAEVDANQANNSMSRMFSEDGGAMLPPFLTTGTSATVSYLMRFSPTAAAGTLVSTSSAPSVLSLPAETPVPAGSYSVNVTATAGAVTGRAKITLQATTPDNPGVPTVFTVPVIAPGVATAKLDVSIIAQKVNITYGEKANITALVAARRHDGTRPTGIVSLLDANKNVVAQQPLNGEAKVTFVRENLQPGSRQFYIRYAGDANFNPLGDAPVTVEVSSWSTRIEADIPALFCAGPREIVFYVRNTSGTTDAPTGSLQVTVAFGYVYDLPLTPTGAPAESRAVLQRTMNAGEYHISANYQPTGTFQAWTWSQQFECVACIGLNLQATATGPESIAVSWTPVQGAARYHVIRSWGSPAWAVVAETTTATSIVDTRDIEPMRAYIYTVRAYDATGNYLGYSRPEIATTIFFDDDPIVAGTTKVRGAHIEHLRTAANLLRTLATPYDVRDTLPMPAGTIVHYSEVVALRKDLGELRRRLGLTLISFTDPVLQLGTPIRAVHIQELRDAVK